MSETVVSVEDTVQRRMSPAFVLPDATPKQKPEAFADNSAHGPEIAQDDQAVIHELRQALQTVLASETELRLLVDNCSSMMAYWNSDLSCRIANRAYEKWFGIDPDSLVGINIRDLLGPELFALNRPFIDGVLAGKSQTFERFLPGPNGVRRSSLTHYIPDLVEGEVVGFLSQLSDVSAQKNTEAALNEAQRVGGIGSWEWSPATDTTTWSLELFNVFGRDPALGSPPFSEHQELYRPESFSRLQTAVENALQHGTPYGLELQFVRPNGTSGWMDTRGEAVFDAQQQIIGLRGTVQDITERRVLLEELEEQHQLLRTTLRSIIDGVITTDADGHVTWLNPVAEQLTGWPLSAALGQPLDSIFHTVDEEKLGPVQNLVEAARRQRRSIGSIDQRLLISRNGAEYSIDASVAPIDSESGKMLGSVLVFRDVSERRRQSREMTHRAQHDALTGLLNRSEFEMQVQRILDTPNATAGSHSLLCIDLDQFKIVNDTCGHAAGDMLLQKVAALLQETVRSDDEIARLGGDEFAVLLENCSSSEAEAIAQQICDRLNDFRFIHDGMRFRVGCSIGLVAIDSRWYTATAIMHAADTACYAAKDGGRNRVHMWFEDDHAIHARQVETRWATRLEAALDEGSFQLFGQRILPIVDTGGGHYIEVLLRLPDSDGTLRLPGAFLPAAERFHFATRIDRFVLKHVITLLGAQPDLSEIDTICVNVSGHSIGDRDFQKAVIAKLTNAGACVCRRICLEITETAAINHMSDAVGFIEKLHSLGVRIALDDFGAGAASFGYLKSLKIDILKIDGQFVKNMADDQLDEAAVRCFIDVGRIRGLKVVAEGVETEDAFARLKELGAHYAQGYLFHMPEPLENLVRLY